MASFFEALSRWIWGEPQVVNRVPTPAPAQPTVGNVVPIPDPQDLKFSGEKSALIWKQNSTEVGSTAVCEVCLFCRNGQPYRLTATDTLQCKVLFNETAIPIVTEPARGSMVGHDKVVVSFNPTLAGKYLITIDMNGHSIGGENNRLKEYNPGPPDPTKTEFNDQNKMFTIQKFGKQTITLTPKDRYGNIISSSDGFAIQIKKNNSEVPNAIRGEIKWTPAGCEIIWQVLLEGFFTGTIMCTPSVILRQFEIICLNDDDAAEVCENVSRMKACYSGQRCTKKEESITITLRPQHILLSKKQMRIMTKKLHCFRVRPSTKIILHDDPNVFTIDDGCGTCVTMSSKSRELIAATYHQFRANISGGSMGFTEKQIIFYDQLKKHHFGEGGNRNIIPIDISISRQQLLQTATNATQNFKKEDWVKQFKVTFFEEPGLDAGGLSREFFELLTEHCFSSQSGMFKAVDDSPQALVHPCTASNVNLSCYKFAGRIVGKCILECALGRPLLVKARFTRSFLVQILGLKPTIECLVTDDPQLYNSVANNSVNNLDLFFACEEYGARTPRVVPLKKNGQSLPVTDDNKMEYLNLLTEYRMMISVQNEVAVFLEGLYELIPEDLLAMFDEKELELLMCGITNVSIEDLRKHTVVEGRGPKWEETVSWFWVAVQGFTSEDMSKFLQFVTGASQLPAKGFADLSNPICIRSFDGQHEKLPSAATCFNRLMLPTYDSYQHLRSALLTAINEGSQGFSMR